MPQTPSRRTVLRGTLGATGTSLLGGCRSEAARELGHSAAPPEPSTRLVPIRVKVNAKPRNLEVDADTSALELVRGQLGLRGSKLACGHGVCGACTMLVDGAPVAACLLPATSLHERSLTTIEGLTGAGGLHPVQRAFMAEDALQCGYCTPGFVVEASAFYARWRAEHGAKEPERDVVAAALAGHLCRCGAYENIVQAVQRACRGDYEREVAAPPRHEAREKVTGAAQYTVDVQLPDQLEVAVLRSPHAHARVLRVDWSQALALPGVAGAVDMMSGATLLRFAGQEIAAVAAVTRGRPRRRSGASSSSTSCRPRDRHGGRAGPRRGSRCIRR
jgi:xanthine dehydrogenase YagR molybdenum-binding subunit